MNKQVILSIESKDSAFFAPSGLLPLLCFTPIQYRINRKEPSETPSKHETFLKNFCTEKPPVRTVLLV